MVEENRTFDTDKIHWTQNGTKKYRKNPEFIKICVIYDNYHTFFPFLQKEKMFPDILREKCLYMRCEIFPYKSLVKTDGIEDENAEP